MRIGVKRVYEPAAASDGARVLVDRLWPRGLSKEAAKIDAWVKEAAPSPELRKWFGHEPTKWAQFKARYFAELDAQPAAVAELRERVGKERVTLVFAARDERFNNAVALKEYLESRGKKKQKRSQGG
jgi:uncharacterized protein YeaO (DUF488 family)